MERPEKLWIWKPISFDPRWDTVDTKKFDNIFPSWRKKRHEFAQSPDEYGKFLDALKRKQAIDTGILERMYDLREGVTATFIKEGFVESYLQHGDTNIPSNLLMNYLRDNFEAIDLVFDFVRSDRTLSVGFIKDLHALITRHQSTTEAMDQDGRRRDIPLISGNFKRWPNNPMRDGTVYLYCPPEQVASEMDMLVGIYTRDLVHSHVLVKSAFLHHAFVQIHPFQDGNGRIARLLASLVLIKENLFPFTLDRSERNTYIDALEEADNGIFQPIVDIFSGNQIKNIERALNLRAIESDRGYDAILQALSQKIERQRSELIARQNELVLEHMISVFGEAAAAVESFRQNMSSKLGDKANIAVSQCQPSGPSCYYYTQQIVKYAKRHDYYFNSSFDKAWIKVSINISGYPKNSKISENSRDRKYDLVFTLHHYGYDNNTFALGAFITYKADLLEVSGRDEESDDRIDVPLDIPPLTASSEKTGADMSDQLKSYIEQCFTVALAYISNEL